MFSLTQTVLSVLLLSVGAHAAVAVKRNTTATCNGYAEFCDRSYGNITYVGAHDSYAVSTTNLAANQDYNVTQQLKDGVRMLQLQAHNQSSTIQLCHTSCDLLNGGTLANYLDSVKIWMDENPNDVVSLLIVNSYDNIPPADYDTVFKSVGLDTMVYSPPSATLTASGWPTLGSLISSGQRLVVFLTTEANFQAVPYLINEFTNIWETAYDVTTTAFDCSVNRTDGDTSTQMYLINHFLDSDVAGIPIPDKSQANVTNGVSGVGSLGQQTSTCTAEYHRPPNFMLVDFYEYGNGSVFEVAASANGVTYAPTSPIATPITGSSTGTGGGTSGSVPGLHITSLHVAATCAMISGVLFGAWSIL
ncbi:uncharacterized protein FIBRA_00109 [Fibroporia radiculosa]|uniref:Phosphatidylinositol-specific phospholipase C X domain-containing protein n=1 Tax=Fibroporia radiculosa TaxID=599839 RepID=J7RUW4_9APHY|nr:uncharacterized protein FIBRA_00109 [Fibroporia radiculosa]CCL98115.1 predicted protein [Fibroporia radiculosa]